MNTGFPRRHFLALGAAALPSLTLARIAFAAEERAKTEFQIACMTLPYAQFPLQRALEGIKAAGYRFVAWGTAHKEDGGKPVPVVAPDAPPERAKELAARCRDLGLEPLMMFSTIYPEAPDGLEVLTQRLKQAAAARVPQVLTFGHTKGGNRELWVKRLKVLGPIARDLGVLLVVKQHGGETGTGEDDVQEPGRRRGKKLSAGAEQAGERAAQLGRLSRGNCQMRSSGGASAGFPGERAGRFAQFHDREPY